MEYWLLLVALGFNLGGALVLALADAWLSRSTLVYLDAVEANVAKMVDALRSASTSVMVTGVDLKRDRGQNVARALKTIGWLALALGFALQFAAVYMTRPPRVSGSHR
jgi:hypothetical protein